MNPRFAFFGSAPFSVAVLEELARAGFVPALLITSPPRPKGRGLAVLPSPVAAWSEAEEIDVLAPEKLDAALLDELRNTPWDLFVVAAYGKILPPELLAIPRRGTLNVHPSLLPKFRGADPVRAAILEDERKTGVSIMLVDEELDHGPLLAQASVEVEDWPPRRAILEELLAREGGRLLAEVMPPWIRGEIVPEPQNDAEASYTRKSRPEDAKIDLGGDPAEALRKIRAFDADPTAYFLAKRNGKTIRVKVTDAKIVGRKLTITRVVPEGKKEMPYEDFLRGGRPE